MFAELKEKIFSHVFSPKIFVVEILNIQMDTSQTIYKSRTLTHTTTASSTERQTMTHVKISQKW